jgi:hypothetical protein
MLDRHHSSIHNHTVQKYITCLIDLINVITTCPHCNSAQYMLPSWSTVDLITGYTVSVLPVGGLRRCTPAPPTDRRPPPSRAGSPIRLP